MATIAGMVRRPLALVHHWWQCHHMPAVLHVTHWKAGSQWIHRILKYCCSDLTVKPRENNEHVLKAPIRQGMIYPTIYATREQLQQLTYPLHVRRFVVIRDPRGHCDHHSLVARRRRSAHPLRRSVARR